MKKHIFLLPAALFPLLLAAQTEWKNLDMSPAKPRPGETISLEYNWLQSNLAQSGNIEVLVLEYVNGQAVGKEVTPRGNGNKLSVSFTTHPDTRVTYVAFHAGENVDNNAGEGYFIPMYTASGQILPESQAAQATMYRSNGALELNRKSETTLDLFRQAFAGQPDLRDNPNYFPAYVSAYLGANRNSDDAKKEMLALLGTLENNPKAGEKTLVAVAELYGRIAPEKSKPLKDRIIAAYPKSTLARAARLSALKMENDMARRTEMIREVAGQLPAETEQERALISEAYAATARQAAEQKNWTAFAAAADRLPGSDRAAVFNDIAWTLAEKNEDIDRAKALAAEAVEWARMEMAVPSDPRPAALTAATWEERRKNNYAMYADTYAYILDKAGDPQSAARYQAEAVEINRQTNVEFNERFTTYLEKAGSPDLRHQLEGFILKGAASARMKEQLKKGYLAEDKSENGYGNYLAALEQVARNNLRAELKRKMLDQPAPAFSLKSLEGKTVTLESLRGKTVVIDFWATWCGPCKASFPGMQQAVKKFGSDPNVAFVFVDTWERVDNKERNASDFIKNNQYDFNVLMDNDNKVVSAFGVSGIPTKFVVDKYGKIRFKSIGYAGSADALLEELSLMIEAAKGVL